MQKQFESQIQKLTVVSGSASARSQMIADTVKDASNPKKFESVLNSWLSQVEAQVNSIEDSLQAKASQADLNLLEDRL